MGAEIAPGVEFNCIAREWRCKWVEDNGSESLRLAQTVLDNMKDEILAVVCDWVGSQGKTEAPGALAGKIDTSTQLVQRVVCTECHDFKVIIKLPAGKYATWTEAEFAPEKKFLEKLGEISGITEIETQTYTLMNVNLMGKIKVPKAENGCMRDSLTEE